MNLKVLGRIMYVEDDPDIGSIAKIALESIGGYTVKICNSGADAINEVDNFSPDLILLDVMMPAMDGPTTLTMLRKINKMENVPVVFVTAKAQSSEIKYFKSLGAVDVIIKPFNPLVLSDKVHDIWKAAISNE